MSFLLYPLTPADHNWVVHLMTERWGAEIVVGHGVVYYPAELPGFVAVEGGERVGLLTYHIEGDACEVVTIDSLKPSDGVGTALIEAVKKLAIDEGCTRL